MNLFADRVHLIGTENAFKLVPRIAELEAAGKKIIRLNIGEPDFHIPDFIKDEIKRQLDANNTHYCDPKGLLSLREAIAKQIFESRNLTVSPDQVVVFPGAKPGIGFSEQVYCNPSDEIIYPTPGFPIYESFINYIGAKPKPLKLIEARGFTFTADSLEELINAKTKLIFLNFPSNPTGGIASLSELEKISEVILRKGHPNLRVYSDEIYENIVFEGKKHVSIASIPGMNERTIISSGFSKTFAWTGGRIGYAIFPTLEEADVFTTMNLNYFSCVPPYNQEAAKVALLHPDSARTIQQMTQIFEDRRNVIVDLLNNIPGVHCQKPMGAFYVFPNVASACQNLGVIELYNSLDPAIRANTSPTNIFKMFALNCHSVAILDRRSFGKINSENEHYLRLSFAADLKILEEGIARLKAAFLDKKGFQDFAHNGKSLWNTL